MESALYGIFALAGFVSEIERVSAVMNSCENPIRARFPWSNLYFRKSVFILSFRTTEQQILIFGNDTNAGYVNFKDIVTNILCY